MRIKDFGVEIYMNLYENNCTYNLAETCVSSLTVEELLDMSGEKNKIIADILKMRLTYGHIEGSPEMREAITTLYRNLTPQNITLTHGAIGANHLVLETLVEPGDEVVSVLPTYQQHYSIPEAIGAKVHILPLQMENKFLPDLDALRAFMKNGIKVVCLNNPNNPSGSVMDEDYLLKIVNIVKPYGAYILCDETYRGLKHSGNHLSASIADLYDKGVSTSSMSKVFSLAGLRIGWVAAPAGLVAEISKHRDYNTISCGAIDDYLATVALQNKERIFQRNLAIVRDNAKILDDWINREPHFSYVKPEGGTTAFLKMNFEMTSLDFCTKLLKETGVMLLPGSAMDVEGFVRIGYAFEPEILITGLEKVSEFVKNFRTYV